MFNSCSSMTIDSSPKEGLFQKVIINYGFFTTSKLHLEMQKQSDKSTDWIAEQGAALEMKVLCLISAAAFDVFNIQESSLVLN